MRIWMATCTVYGDRSNGAGYGQWKSDVLLVVVSAQSDWNTILTKQWRI